MRTQSNALFQRVVDRGLRPADFTLEDMSDATYVNHLPTDSYFSMSSYDGVVYRGRVKIGKHGSYLYGEGYWDNIVEVFDRWLYNVRIEAETPDMWEEFRRVGGIVAATQRETYENTPFTSQEQAQISARLKEIKESIQKTYSLSVEQFAAVADRLDEAEEASRRIGRKDWTILFLGMTLPFIFSALVPPDVIQHIIVMFFDTLGHLFGGGFPPLPPTA